MKSLLIYPTHENCREVEEGLIGKNINAMTYPARVTEATENMRANCWNAKADEAEAMGFAVVKTVCSGCESRQKCGQRGYLAELIAVSKADVALCTHKRAEFSGLKELLNGRGYLSIHENPIDLLRPRVDANESDLILIQHILKRILNDPRSLDWFGDDLRVDEEGNKVHDEDLAKRKERQFQFCHHLLDLVDSLVVQLLTAASTMEWRPNVVAALPDGIERTLFFATKGARAVFSGQPWRFVLAAGNGALHSAAIVVEQRHQKGAGQGNTFTVKQVVGFRDNPPPANVVAWFNDATLVPDRLEMILGRKVQDTTPIGRLELQKKAVQVLRDITRRTTAHIFGNVLRGVLADRPQFKRIGVICHWPHIAAVNALGPDFDHRIVKVTYFGSGDDRSSNAWHQECDLIIVAGTPRLPPGVIATYLIQVGEIGAACRQPEWGKVFWHGTTESGEPKKVKGAGYQDEAWRKAHRDLVRAHLVQAIGRGRGILATGCEVVVLTNEECGLAISDAGFESVNGTAIKVLQAMRDLSAQIPNKDILGICALKSADIASRCGIEQRQTQLALQILERKGLARRVGDRSGWIPVTQEDVSCPA
jgi:hypothetical protein